MENCVIYSHYLNFEKIIDIVKRNLPKAEIELNENGLNKSLVISGITDQSGEPKTLKINYRQRKNPSYQLKDIECDLTKNLAGMVNFVKSIPSKNEDIKNVFLYKVMAVNCEIAFMAEPEIDSEFEKVLQEIVTELDAFLFSQPSNLFCKSDLQHFLDKHFDLILDMEGNCEISKLEVNVESKYHDQTVNENKPDQIERKTKSENFLMQNGIKVNKNLPYTPSAERVKIRERKEIIDRAYALLAVSAKGEGVEQKHLDRVIKEKNITRFSPLETSIVKHNELTDQNRAYATWRYECLYLLLWVLGIIEELKYPSDICDVKQVVGLILNPSREAFEKSVNFKRKSEILDELDKIYRMHWACVDARIKGEQVSGNINADVVYERHYVLNWLTNYQDSEWDDVQTNT